jgi:5-methylcytosine-specific restriction endonuclease McrA
MRSKVPDGDLAAIIEDAVTDKLKELEARRFGAAKTPRIGRSATGASSASRHIPAATKRAVSERDDRRCHFRNKEGRRCSARAGLEYHHRYPFAFGGGSGPDNLVLVCRVHHRLHSEHDYGPAPAVRPHTPARQSDRSVEPEAPSTR